MRTAIDMARLGGFERLAMQSNELVGKCEHEELLCLTLKGSAVIGEDLGKPTCTGPGELMQCTKTVYRALQHLSNCSKVKLR